MQEISLKLHKQVMDEFHPIAEDLAKKGFGKDDIVNIFQAQLKLKTRQYYQRQHNIRPVGEILKDYRATMQKESADSKAEKIFFEMLTDLGIKFKFQYPIGPYKADYLLGGFLVVELDGPQHKKERDDRRDLYMRKMGYKIIRVPIWILVSCPDAVINEILQVLVFKGE
jgi:very-short-patch-repair endonuclease